MALYRAEPPEALVVRALDDLTLIFHRRSGQTHVVMAPVPEILAALGGEMLDAAGVAARLSADFEIESEDDFAAVVEARLEELVALGLVRRG